MSEKNDHCGGKNCPPFEYACVDGCLHPVKPIEEAHGESQESMWQELFEDIELMGASPESTSKQLSKKWGLTRKQP